MNQRVKSVWVVLRDTYEEYSRDNASNLAASIAFYAVFSVAPLLIIATAIAGFVFGKQGAEAEVAEYLADYTNPQTQQFILDLVANWQDTATGIVATIIGVGTLIWGAYRLFMALQSSLNMIWAVRPRRDLGFKDWVRMRLMPFGMVVLVGLLLLASMLASAVLSALQQFFAHAFPIPPGLANFVNFVISFGLLTVLFAAVFKVLPDVVIRWRDVWIGAAMTAFLFAVGKSFIGLYLGHTSTTSIFGAAGSLVALLFWVYFSAQIFFVGAEFTQVYARHQGKNIVPDKRAVRVEAVSDHAPT